ncbi:MAG TPA: hypothetical protein VHI52_07510, partial [Verrucomicrobiae bacterium]|nr:hypothetical protein [Verrucomicrobiae bacterium]
GVWWFDGLMARVLRIQRPGGRYHVTARGNERKDIFRDAPDHFHFLELLSQLGERYGARVHAFVLSGVAEIGGVGPAGWGLDCAVVSKALARFSERLAFDISSRNQLASLQNDLSK